ncbi:hypothetical protein HXX76_013868 [Chlamydomonas incerta]|uniref:tRNA/rRNA methyltransferase SpoU type domain-containing protein n=1 Tax=Chlamydomonas incerta TaxID=51695 RepID=A0A835SDI4_CHLIN|nr:hypothetical protein HXX76_013868 [Chlamydomonas incerta]|eukprot:KAG2425287.1 hypothetical protein HXX76_013868 [Chlamydomonas incerta]
MRGLAAVWAGTPARHGAPGLLASAPAAGVGGSCPQAASGPARIQYLARCLVVAAAGRQGPEPTSQTSQQGGEPAGSRGGPRRQPPSRPPRGAGDGEHHDQSPSTSYSAAARSSYSGAGSSTRRPGGGRSLGGAGRPQLSSPPPEEGRGARGGGGGGGNSHSASSSSSRDAGVRHGVGDVDDDATAADTTSTLGLRGPPLPEVDFIASAANAFVKHCVRLRTSGPYRRECGRALLVGEELIAEAAGSSRALAARVLLLAEGAEPPRAVAVAAGAVVRVSEAVMKKVTGLENAAGVTAVAELDMPPQLSLRQLLRQAAYPSPSPSSSPSLAPTPSAPGAGASAASPASSPPLAAAGTGTAAPRAVRLLVLDGVQDPGNLGTLVRSALAFGWHGLLLLPGCCDPLNDKAVRASRGAVLRLPVAAGTMADLEAAAAELGLLLLCADMEDEGEGAQGQGGAGAGAAAAAAAAAAAKGAASCSGPGTERGLLESGGLLPRLKANAAASAVTGGSSSGGASGSSTSGRGRGGGVALVLGSEGQGLSRAVRALCRPVAVPMSPGAMESLNVGVAGALLMFALSEGPPRLFGRLAGLLSEES